MSKPVQLLRRSFELASPRGSSPAHPAASCRWKLPEGLTVAFSNVPPSHGLPCQREARFHLLAEQAVRLFVPVQRH